MFTAALTNTLIMAQIVLGAALTGLGASKSSPVLVTIFGATNTIIAGGIAFLKSRGQPMRARMFRDDLERVVDEIENSAIMWLGISKGAHGYDAIDTDDEVTVRGEVARLTRLYDRAVKTNTLNDPDNYNMGGPSDPHAAALRDKAALSVPAAPPPQGSVPAASTSVQGAPPDPDASPATKAPGPPKASSGASTPTNDKTSSAASSLRKGKETATVVARSSGPTVVTDPSSSGVSNNTSQATPAAKLAPADADASPTSAAHPEKHSEDTSEIEDAKK